MHYVFTLTGLFALADNIMSKVLKTGEGITNIFIADNDSVRGLTWALASVASSKDLEVTWEGNSNGNSKHQLLKDISNEYLEANRIHSKLFDCIICPCDLHPVDREALISATRKGKALFLCITVKKQNKIQYSAPSTSEIDITSSGSCNERLLNSKA